MSNEERSGHGNPDGGFWNVFVDLWGGHGWRTAIARTRRSPREHCDAVDREVDRLRTANSQLQEGLPPPRDEDGATK